MRRPDGPACQSCGMPLSRDAQGGGTEADGRRTTEYCSHCYQGGAFTEPDITAVQMTEKVRGMLMRRQVPAPAVEVMVAGISSLRRWRP